MPPSFLLLFLWGCFHLYLFFHSSWQRRRQKQPGHGPIYWLVYISSPPLDCVCHCRAAAAAASASSSASATVSALSSLSPSLSLAHWCLRFAFVYKLWCAWPVVVVLVFTVVVVLSFYGPLRLLALLLLLPLLPLLRRAFHSPCFCCCCFIRYKYRF